MGKEKHIKKVMELFKKSPVVSADSIFRIVGRGYYKQLIRNLILQGRIKRIVKGYYTLHEDPSLIVFCLDGYLGLQDALSVHNLWEQETIPVVITSKKVRQGIRKVFGGNVLVCRIELKYFFGFNYLQNGGFYLPVSDIEKTFIDMVYFRQRMDEDLLKSFNEKLDLSKLKIYLKRYPNKFKLKVLDLIN